PGHHWPAASLLSPPSAVSTTPQPRLGHVYVREKTPRSGASRHDHRAATLTRRAGTGLPVSFPNRESPDPALGAQDGRMELRPEVTRASTGGRGLGAGGGAVRADRHLGVADHGLISGPAARKGRAARSGRAARGPLAIRPGRPSHATGPRHHRTGC